MIGRVAGRLLYRAGDHVLIDVKGVGYLVHVSDRVMAGLPRNGEAVALFTELQVREDGWTLFGFPTLVEKEWHRLLLTVQGVGAKVSLALLGAHGHLPAVQQIRLQRVEQHPHPVAAHAGLRRDRRGRRRVAHECRQRAPANAEAGGGERVHSGGGFKCCYQYW